MDAKWRKLTQAAPELAASCEEMMVELAWRAEQARKAGGDDADYKNMVRMVVRAVAALAKAGIEVESEAPHD